MALTDPRTRPTTATPPPLTIVSAAVISDSGGSLLLTRRPAGRHMAGLWEFPGGKVQDGETPAQALVRELREELAVGVRVEEPMTFAVHEEPGLRVLLLFYRARLVTGDPAAVEGQEIAWVPSCRLADYRTPPADAALVRHLQRTGGP